MRAKNPIRLTPRERLSRGLQYTAVGPVDVTRGLVGLGAHSAQAGASSLRRRVLVAGLVTAVAAGAAVAAGGASAVSNSVTVLVNVANQTVNGNGNGNGNGGQRAVDRSSRDHLLPIIDGEAVGRACKRSVLVRRSDPQGPQKT